MPDQMDMADAGQHASPEAPQQADERSGLSRRSALRAAAAAGIGAAAIGAVGVPALADATASRHDAARQDAGQEDTAAEPIVAHLRDARTGEIDVFRGTSQTRLHDRALADALIRASR